MLEIDKFLTAKPSELEGFTWYEIMSKLGLQSFNFQGNKPIEHIAKLSQITESSKVLMVGCGTGGTAVHLAEITGCTLFGIDISQESIRIANENASKSFACEKLHFTIGDATNMDFPANTFDVVITEFMAFFLPPQTFMDFLTILKPGGLLAMAELVKDQGVTAKADKKIFDTEKIYSELLGYKFHIPLVTNYIDWLTRAGFNQVRIDEYITRPSTSERIKSMGGWKQLFKIIKVMLRLMHNSHELKNKFIQMGRVKRILYENKPTAKFISQVILAGWKS